MKHKICIYSLYLTLLFSFGVVVLSIIGLTPLVNHNAQNFTEILTAGSLYWQNDSRFLINILTYYPTYFFVTHFNASDTTFAVTKYIYMISHIIYPLLGLLLSYKVLSRLQKKEYIVLPLLTYALMTLPSMFIPVNTATISISLFWPTYFQLLECIKYPKRKIPLISFILGSLLIAITYELTIIYFLFFIAMGVYEYRKEKINLLQLWSIILPSFTLIAFILIKYKSSIVTGVQIDYFWESLYLFFVSKESFFIPFFLFIFMLLGFWKGEKKVIGQTFNWVLAVLTIYIVYHLYSFAETPIIDYWSFSSNLRTVSIPITLVFVGLFHLNKNRTSKEQIIYIITILLISSSFMYGVANLRNFHAVKSLQVFVDKFSGCQTLSLAQQDEIVSNTALLPEYLPVTYLSTSKHYIFDQIILVASSDLAHPCKHVEYNNFVFDTTADKGLYLSFIYRQADEGIHFGINHLLSKESLNNDLDVNTSRDWSKFHLSAATKEIKLVADTDYTIHLEINKNRKINENFMIDVKVISEKTKSVMKSVMFKVGSSSVLSMSFRPITTDKFKLIIEKPFDSSYDQLHYYSFKIKNISIKKNSSFD